MNCSSFLVRTKAEKAVTAVLVDSLIHRRQKKRTKPCRLLLNCSVEFALSFLDIVLRSWTGHFILTVSLSTQVYKWIPATLILGVILRWTSIPSRGGGGGRNTPSHFMLRKPEISSSLMDHLARMQTTLPIA